MERDDLRWERIRRVFFPRPAAPSAAETEAFTARVMSRLPEPEAEERPFWTSQRWFAPALGFSLAVFACSFLSLGGEPEDPATALLLADSGGSAAAEFMARAEAVTPDSAFSLILEGE